jgi:Ca2+-binding RTX toxin-like protein
MEHLGDDILDGGTGDDRYQDTFGNDIYYIDNPNDFILPTTNEQGYVDTVRSTIDYALPDNMENLELLGSSDLIGYGNRNWNYLVGNSGNNILDGKEGGDTLEGGLGDDVYVVDSTLDVVVERSGEGTDIVESGVSYTLSDFVEQCFLNSPGRNQSLTGNTLGNLLVGNSGQNTLSGLDGKDELRGEGGSDSLYGGNGIDTLDGGTGADHMEGGAKNDIYYVDNGLDEVIEQADAGYDTVFTSVAIAMPDNVEKLVFNGLADGTMLSGNDLKNFLVGNYTDDIIDVGAGSDSVRGGAGDDTILGGAGRDTLLGEFGIDSIEGGLGRDILFGGAGADLFVFVGVTDSTSANRDLIKDFEDGLDRIDLRQIDTNAAPGDQAFAFIGSDAFTDAWQVRVVTTAIKTRIEVSIDADTDPEMVILLNGIHTLTEASFLL